jgi:hypothetical protein
MSLTKLSLGGNNDVIYQLFPPRESLASTKLSLGGNNDVIYQLFPPRESLASDILAGDGNIEKLFYGVTSSLFSPPVYTFSYSRSPDVVMYVSNMLRVMNSEEETRQDLFHRVKLDVV